MWAKLLLLLLCFSFLLKADLTFNQDLGRHIKLGEIITKTHQVPKTNLFSYTNPDTSFINTHWLFEVLAYFFAATGTIQFFLILKIAIILLPLWLTLKVIPKGKEALLLPLGFVMFHVLRERTGLRPEIFSFLFTGLTMYILEKNNKKYIFLLPVISLMWINTHIYFFIGLMLQAIYLIHRRTKLLAVVLGLSIAISLINPSGVQGLLYPLNVRANYGYTIVENQTLFLLESINFQDPNFIFVKLSWAIAVLSLLFAFIRRDFNIKNILLVATGVTLSLLNVRSFPYLVFLSFPAILANFGSIKVNSLTKITAAIFGGMLILESGLNFSQAQFGFVESGKGALDFVLKNDLPGPIYNNFDIGSYIIYRGYPKYKVFVDGRPEAYPKEFFRDVYIPSQADYSKFKELENKWHFKTIIFSHTDQTPWAAAFMQALIKDPSWKQVYLDDFIVVLVKKEI